MAKRIRKHSLNLTEKNSFGHDGEGAFSHYYKLNDTQGLKVLFGLGYSSIKKLRTSRDWRNATRESTLIKKASKRVNFTPKFFETVPVKIKNIYYAGIIMQHIEGKRVESYYTTKTERRKVLRNLCNSLENAGIIHDDLHEENAIVCSKSLIHYVIDFSPDFVEILDE